MRAGYLAVHSPQLSSRQLIPAMGVGFYVEPLFHRHRSKDIGNLIWPITEYGLEYMDVMFSKLWAGSTDICWGTRQFEPRSLNHDFTQ